MMSRMLSPGALVITLLLLAWQPGVTATDGWVAVSQPAATDTSAFVTLANGGMYEAYLVGASTDIAERVEFVQLTQGKATIVKEVVVPAFDRLEMTPEGTHLKLVGLKSAVSSGDRVSITFRTDDGGTIVTTAVAK